LKSVADVIYFFLDGGYIRAKYADAMKRVFGVENAEADFATVHQWCYGRRFGGGVFSSPVPQRFFYYDCLPDSQKNNETEQEFKKRVEQQNGVFKGIQSLPGFHVRLGSMAGTGRKIRQKKVDVLLAVEMLDNAFRQNMAVAVLLTGDGDFVPVVEAVLRLGTWVEVCYDPLGASEELYSTADRAVPLTFQDFWLWGTKDFRTKYPLPSREVGVSPSAYSEFLPRNLKRGKNAEGEMVILAERGTKLGEFILYVDGGQGSGQLFTYTDRTILEAYYTEQYGGIVWDKRP
jgi:hypothetical protein